MIQKIQEKLKQINWTSLFIGVTIGASAYYFYQKYTVKKQTESLRGKQSLRV